ncbi:hemolysin family protein [Anaerosporobacter sp.]|uniref:hemolysin family protein n=1 Tax=Anaerosporobacter sp. TaxID=1872529 RepID=UPI00286ED8E5|nr:hemolysin family protein [Anaerosporobacter sp.]
MHDGYPITFLRKKITTLILRLCGNKSEDLEDEIISMVNEGQEQGVLASNEAEMISNIIAFDEKEVKDIMTHRKKIVAIDCNETVEQTLRFMLDKSYSRYPLYEDDIDNIIGILHVKDVARCYMSPKFKNKPLKLIARKPYFVPDTQNINVLFSDMQLKKVHMAIAVDEYGQTAGLVAMEDILEEIVGNILDEYDIDEKLIIKQDEGQFLMKGLAGLDDIEDILGIEIQEEDFDTLNGLLTSLLNRIPNDGEHVSLSYGGYLFEILDVRNKMIRYVRVTKELEENLEDTDELE